MKNNKNFFAAIGYVCIALVLMFVVMLILRCTRLAMIPMVIVLAPLWVPFAAAVISLSVLILVAAFDGRKPRYISKDIEDDR